MKPGHRWALFAVTAALLLAGLVVRLELAHRLDGYVDPDEAVVALMATHVSGGQGLPVFFYGQPYLGALESWILGLTFVATGGPDVAAARMVLTMLWLTLAALVISIAAREGPTTILLAAWLCAAVPPQVMLWQLKFRGGFLLSAVLVALSLYLVDRAARGGNPIAISAFAVAAGLTLWTNQLALPAMVVFVVALVRSQPGCRGRITVGLLSGLAPALWYNLVHPLATPIYLARGLLGEVPSATESLGRLWSETLPAVVGDGRGWAGPVAAALAIGLTLLSRWRVVRDDWRARRCPQVLDLAWIALAVSLPLRRNFQLNQFLHLFPLFVLTVAGMPRLTGRKVSAVLPVVVAVLAMFGVASWLPEYRMTAAPVLELVQALDELGVKSVYAEHRPAYLIAFHSDERIAATPTLSYGYEVDRYPPYTAAVRADARAASVFEAGSTNEQRFQAESGRAGADRVVNGFAIYLVR